ncbi:protein-export chaperone SecB [Commensalibacter papalotli (ex Botero et al. 2024)]|uniref:protein-export chaperone SecB n=1 Tax=Commensalibacter papalotli (ex Botero et al. 2024) TaxID=2972766 RepID=UPI0022FFA23F|nr:protein-export chaperone SecB [Commensalibacter papalotli (ex Botero et al. 2024)]CAI3944715.1 Preprotein translocase subunit SecB (SecB) (PDB:1OZB) [Commensalibacter papalotli (ex Botero et al. 2024)]
MPDNEQTLPKTKLSDLILKTQYIKEISLKTPDAPHIFTNMPSSPNLTVTVDVNAQQLIEGEANFDVTVFISCVSTNQNSQDEDAVTIFSLHLQYAALVTFPALETSNLEELLMVNTPDLLFPEIRNIILNTTKDANLPPVILQRIDFYNMWKEKKRNYL